MMSNAQDPVVIVKAKRTPIGAFLGVYATVATPKLGGAVISDLINTPTNNGNLNNLISEVIMGCVLPAGLGQAPARQAALAAGLSNSVPCTTINKMCGSGLKTIVQGYNNLLADSAKIIVAGGMENMSLAPYLIPKGRTGMRLGHGTVLDHMFFDGLEDAYNPGCLMGHFAERTAKKYRFTRELQDEYALLSAKKAIAAGALGKFTNEISQVRYTQSGSEATVSQDETIDKVSNLNIEKIKKLKPVFVKPEELATGTVTAANSSSIADGAAAVVLMRLSKAQELGLKPIAKIVDYTEVAHEPEWFTTAPILAIQNLLNQTKLKISDIDLFEINEAFAVVTMAAINDLKLDHEKVNIYGGACALGHPIGATGTRIIVTLLNALINNNKHRGVASLCIGGGEALAMVIELI